MKPELTPAISLMTAWIRLPFTIASGVRRLTEISGQLGAIEDDIREVRECIQLGVGHLDGIDSELYRHEPQRSWWR